jgi:hypothetical protein
LHFACHDGIGCHIGQFSQPKLARRETIGRLDPGCPRDFFPQVRPTWRFRWAWKLFVTASVFTFVSLPDLLDRLVQAQAESRMRPKMAHLRKCRLLILDEIGYRNLDRQATTCLFQLIGERYERGSIILTSNKSYGEWGTIFQDNVIASAILDRLLTTRTPSTSRATATG